MVSICGDNYASTLSSDDLASSDVFVKLSQYTSVEMSDFTVFVIVFLSYYLHLHSLKYHVSEMILGSQSYANIPMATHSQSNVVELLQQSKTFDVSLVKFFPSLGNLYLPALLWIVLLSLAFAVYAVVKTSKCQPDKVCLEAAGDLLDFDYTWVSFALGLFILHKFVFGFLLLKNSIFRTSKWDRKIRGISFILFIMFYIFMILTTFKSSPETKHHEDIPCTSKGSFVGQLIYWPLFLIIVFYIERGSYILGDGSTTLNLVVAVSTFILSTLLFMVPMITIGTWQSDSCSPLCASSNLRSDLGTNSNPIVFQGRHTNTGPGIGAVGGVVIGFVISVVVLGMFRKGYGRFNMIKSMFIIIIASGLGAASGAAAGAINQAIINKRKIKLLLESNSSGIERDWKKCLGDACNTVAESPVINYTSTTNCTYPAKYNMDFSQYGDVVADTRYAFQSRLIENETIYFKQTPADDPIWGEDSTFYWIFLLVISVIFTILAFAMVMVTGTDTGTAGDGDGAAGDAPTPTPTPSPTPPSSNAPSTAAADTVESVEQ